MKWKSMKFKLMIQSLSPLALLTIIRNLKFVSLNADGFKLGIVEFASANKILLIVIFLCCVWILLSMWYYLATMSEGRFGLVFTPQYGSWLNMIESFFSKLTKQIPVF